MEDSKTAQADIATRIAVLETSVAGTERCLNRLVREVDEIKASLHRIELNQERRAAIPLCGAPNKCVDLERQLAEIASAWHESAGDRAEMRAAVRQLADLTSLVNTLVSDRAEAKGAIRASIMWASAVSALVSGGIALAVKAWPLVQHVP